MSVSIEGDRATAVFFSPNGSGAVHVRKRLGLMVQVATTTYRSDVRSTQLSTGIVENSRVNHLLVGIELRHPVMLY